MRYEWGNRKVKAIALRASWFLRVTFLFMLHTSYLIPSASSQQASHPVLDTACQCGGGAMTATPTNAGTNFLLCFEENIDEHYQSNYSADGYLGIYCVSLGDLDTVTITCNHYPSYSKVFILQPNASFDYTVEGDSLLSWIVSDETVDDRVVQVHSNAPIVCYGMNYKRWSADAFCALPQEYSGTQYSVMSYATSASDLDGPATSSEFAVAAFEDNTIVKIWASAITINGNPVGDTETYTLQQGQCVQIQSDTPNRHNGFAYLDLTGSTIASNHPVAVYGGHVETEIPDGWQRLPYVGPTRDMLLEAMPPASDLGYSFVLEPVTLDSSGDICPVGDLMRVLAVDTNTQVFVNGNLWVTLKSPSNPNSFADSLITSPVLVTSSNPLLVAEMEHSSYTYYGPGDPFLAIIPPMEQTYNNYTFYLPPDTNFSYQSVIIAADVTCQNNIMLDGRLLPVSDFKSVPGTSNGRAFSICQVRAFEKYNGLQPGVHVISTTTPAAQAFTILAYGVGFANAYGYAAGQLLVPMRSIMIEQPPQFAGSGHTNTLNFHNTAYQPAYLDSAVFIPDNFKDAGYGIHTLEDVGLDIGRIDIGGSGQIHLVSNNPLIYPVNGQVKMYAHMPSYFSVEPAVMDYTLYPDALADVSQSNTSALSVTATPNPFSSYTTIRFSIPESIADNVCDLTITLYDELGRVVRTVAPGEVSAGPNAVTIDRLGLPNGVYTCVIASARLNIRERIPVVAGD